MSINGALLFILSAIILHSRFEKNGISQLKDVVYFSLEIEDEK